MRARAATRSRSEAARRRPSRRGVPWTISTSACSRATEIAVFRRRGRHPHGGCGRRPAHAADDGKQGQAVRRPDRDPQADHPRPHADAGRLYAGAGARPNSSSASARPAPARPISPSPMPPAARARPGRAHHPVAPGRRGRRAARLPARRHEGEGRSLSAAALRRALRHDARPTRSNARSPPASSRSRRSPSCAAARWRMPP